MQERALAVNGGTIGLVLGAVLYAGVWLRVFGSGSPFTSYLWISFGGLALGGLAGFTLGRERLVTPVSLALLVLLVGVLSTGGVDGGMSSPGAYSMVFIFGWPLLFVLAGLLALVEHYDSIWPRSPL
ncbi:hypothetical protein LPA44_12710 [Halobacterium sp. KA-4]|uniref:hypothetical protein n=1 Tax=Halobacterium sp. KA-4 TaxID=2896367 RepID=UPI001E4E7827|nr:hypothetical protein [Halobacterium sp. KA-4]MCD2200752.1 hypothetical protein [Halobacterium sp. KA-4]